jgi:hypothetical protein
MSNAYFAAPELASPLDGSSAGELIPELARYGLQQLIELEASAVVGADRHERTEERLAYRADCPWPQPLVQTMNLCVTQAQPSAERA